MLRGQASITGLVVIVLDLIFLAYLIPVMQPMIDAAILTAGLDAFSIQLLHLIIPVIIIGTITGFLAYLIPQRQGYYG